MGKEIKELTEEMERLIESSGRFINYLMSKILLISTILDVLLGAGKIQIYFEKGGDTKALCLGLLFFVALICKILFFWYCNYQNEKYSYILIRSYGFIVLFFAVYLLYIVTSKELLLAIPIFMSVFYFEKELSYRVIFENICLFLIVKWNIIHTGNLQYISEEVLLDLSILSAFGFISFICTTKGCELLVELENHRKVSKLNDALNGASWILNYDKNGKLADAEFSKSFRKMAGYTEEFVVENGIELWKDLVHPDDLISVENTFRELMSDEKEIEARSDIIFRLGSSTMGYRYVLVAIQVMHRKNGTLESIYGVLHDIDKEMLAKQKLDKALLLAKQDPLTKLWNKGAFEELQNQFGKREDLAMVIIDIDHFKEINDNYGHDVGDEILKFVSKSIKKSFRNTDYVCRFGGDEFSVILTEIDESKRDAIEQKLDRLIKKMEKMPENLPTVTVSMGIAFANKKTMKTHKLLFKNADAALYVAKENGRNRYAFFEANEV